MSVIYRGKQHIFVNCIKVVTPVSVVREVQARYLGHKYQLSVLSVQDRWVSCYVLVVSLRDEAVVVLRLSTESVKLVMGWSRYQDTNQVHASRITVGLTPPSSVVLSFLFLPLYNSSSLF